MKTIFLWLEGPLQSWGDRSRFGRRETQNFPTKSGIWGMIFCAAGLAGPQREALAEVADSPMTSIRLSKTQETAVKLTDFHMVGNGYDGTDPWENLLVPKTSDGKKAVGGGAKMTYREYLQDTVFAVFLTVSDDWAQKISEALQMPHWDICLGRKNCAPSQPVFRGVYESLGDAQQAYADELSRRNQEGKQTLFPVETVEDIPFDSDRADGFLVSDVPVAFGLRKEYRERLVAVTPVLK